MRRYAMVLAVAAMATLTVVACSADDPNVSDKSRASEAVQSIEMAPGAPAMAPAPPTAVTGGFAAGSDANGQLRARMSRDEQAPGRGSTADATAGTSGSAEASAQSASAMIIRTGSAVVEVDSLERAIADVRLLAARVGGYVANTSVQTGREQFREATLELKIPAPRFDDAISGLSPLGRVEAVNVSAEDVGEEFTDLTARTANARRLEERLIELLATRTGKLDDVLSVERELARVREQIERMEGRMRFLQARAATSTLSVSLHEPFPVLGQRGQNPIGEAFRDAWRNFVGFVAAFISALGILVPLGALGLAAWVVIRRFVPKRAAEGPAAA